MAWNEPGNRGEAPWGKKRPAGKSAGGVGEAMKHWQQRLQSMLGGPSGDAPESGSGDGGDSMRLGLMFTGLVLVLWLLTGAFQINASDKGVIQRFGAFSGEVRGEGWGLTYPWPIAKVTKVNVSEVNSFDYHTSRMLTGDLNLVDIRAAIQYQNADPVKVLFQVTDVEKTLQEVSESAFREVVGQATLDGVLGPDRQMIGANSRDLIQRTLDTYNSGIRVISVNITNVQVPEAVGAAQLDANKAKEDKERYSNAAQAYANDILPRAQGDAQRQLQEAEAYKARVVIMAEGDVARFNSIYSAYAQAPEVTRQRLYIEAIEDLMMRSKKIILDAKGGSGGNMIYLPLDKLLERSTAPRTPAPATPSAQPLEELQGVTIEGRSRGTR